MKLLAVLGERFTIVFFRKATFKEVLKLLWRKKRSPWRGRDSDAREPWQLADVIRIDGGLQYVAEGDQIESNGARRSRSIKFPAQPTSVQSLLGEILDRRCANLIEPHLAEMRVPHFNRCCFLVLSSFPFMPRRSHLQILRGESRERGPASSLR